MGGKGSRKESFKTKNIRAQTTERQIHARLVLSDVGALFWCEKTREEGKREEELIDSSTAIFLARMSQIFCASEEVNTKKK